MIEIYRSRNFCTADICRYVVVDDDDDDDAAVVSVLSGCILWLVFTYTSR